MKELDIYEQQVKLIKTEEEKKEFFLKGIDVDMDKFFRELDKQINEVLK